MFLHIKQLRYVLVAIIGLFGGVIVEGSYLKCATRFVTQPLFFKSKCLPVVLHNSLQRRLFSSNTNSSSNTSNQFEDAFGRTRGDNRFLKMYIYNSLEEDFNWILWRHRKAVGKMMDGQKILKVIKADCDALKQQIKKDYGSVIDKDFDAKFEKIKNRTVSILVDARLKKASELKNSNAFAEFSTFELICGGILGVIWSAFLWRHYKHFLKEVEYKEKLQNLAINFLTEEEREEFNALPDTNYDRIEYFRANCVKKRHLEK